MKRSLFYAIAAAIVIVNAAGAQAADMPGQAQRPSPSYYKAPELPPFDWSGFYLGANGGYGRGRTSWSDPAAGAGSGNFRTRGALAGGQIGYNWQIGKIVVGVESDIDRANFNGSSAAGGVCATNGGGQCESRQSWLGTTRARLGRMDSHKARHARIPSAWRSGRVPNAAGEMATTASACSMAVSAIQAPREWPATTIRR